jgi:hypothetical protein
VRAIFFTPSSPLIYAIAIADVSLGHSSLEGSTLQVSEQGLRKVLYQKASPIDLSRAVKVLTMVLEDCGYVSGRMDVIWPDIT